jgi:F-type H+-transporting ATPase subunit gamma
MATTLSLRRRIKTARNISKTTRALQMISASRLKRAQEAALSARPYVNKLVTVTQSLAPLPGVAPLASHPYMELHNTSGKTLYIIISPDKGLCGGLVTNLAREYIKSKNDHAFFVTVGKKIEGVVAPTSKKLLAAFPFGRTVPSFSMVAPLSKIIDEYYLTHQVDAVKIITTKFMNVFSQTPVVTNVLPIAFEGDGQKEEAEERIFEPSRHELMPSLLRRYIDMVIYQHLLESYASEQAARMIAMQNATNNAKDVVNALTLLYNKARQEKITKEILDITSGAVAMEQAE